MRKTNFKFIFLHLLIHCTLSVSKMNSTRFCSCFFHHTVYHAVFSHSATKCVEMDDKYRNMNYLTHLLQYGPDDGFISVPQCEIDSTVSEGMKVIQNKAKASKWESILRKRCSQKFSATSSFFSCGFFICSCCLYVFLLPQ